MERNARGIPPAESAACSSGPSHGDESVSGPLHYSDDQYDVQSPYREEITLGLSNHAAGANQPRPIGSQANEGSGREIAHVVPNLSAMGAQTPSGWVSLRNQNETQINSPIRSMAALTAVTSPVQALPCMEGDIPSAMTPAMMPVPTLPSTVGQNKLGKTPAMMPVPILPNTVGQNKLGKTPAMMPVPTLPWMAGEDPEAWIRLLKQDYSHYPAMTPPVWNQIPVQICSPARAMAPSVMIQEGTPTTIPNNIHTPPRSVSAPIHAWDISGRVQGIGVPSGSPHSPAWAGMSSPTFYCSTSNASREKASPQMEALDGMEFRKIFMIFAYLSGRRIEDELSVDYIRSLQRLPMDHFESRIWNEFGCKYMDVSDRTKNLDSNSGTARVYHCNVEIRGDYAVKIFKGPYVETRRTHLAKVIGDDNVLVVKIIGKSSKDTTDFAPYHKVAEDGIFLGLRRYRFFLYKDGGKEEKIKEDRRFGGNEKCTSAVRCYFVRTESGWKMDEPYILSGKTISQARKLFMHVHTAPTLAKYMARFALILSKTITLEADLSVVHVIQLDDKPCSDEYGNIVVQDDEPLIHTDGTGLISEDLAMKCSTSISERKDIVSCDETPMVSSRAKRRRSIAPLLTQFRMFYKGAAVKGTALVDRRLPSGTILIRPSMIKIKSDPELCGVQTVNSLEIVTTSNQPKRTLTSKYLIALLYYGGVKAEYFIELLHDAIEGAENARYGYGDALKLAFIYADMEDSMSARMLLSGVPLEDAYLQSRLATMSQLERKGIKEGKLPINDCFYLMGTTDPTGKLRPNEVCVILDRGQYSGKVLVYKHPGLHFGDIHVLTSRYIKDIDEAVGHSRYAILFPTSGPRSLADEMANSDYDGDMYWVSINAQLLQQFKPSKPWIQKIKPKKACQMCPQVFNESLLERNLFNDFLKARFARSSVLSTAADCWLVYMDRLITDDLDEGEREVLEKKMEILVDLYYLALDAAKTGMKINVPSELIPKSYPHFMDRKQCYHSNSILGRIYDEAVKLQSENVGPIEISLDPRFNERGTSECKPFWTRHYKDYLTESGPLSEIQDKEEVNLKFNELYHKYKHILYHAAEFEQTPRDLKDVFDEACAIYQIAYESAVAAKKPGRCSFVWKVAGRALCHFYALETEDDKVLVPLSIAKSFLVKGRKK
ncbi:probable RNA-dependent RNA polymerase 3 isoform X1 [Lolium perenne]|uniref:probable RNA-dependent RNA polymerase 3 isoform X1 n=1 Tax=Lolium perenne TaxID=4522 RepID=UPI0021F5C0F7|nr:probable RNA-dependent RNA polymerase 4 isoform X1 [Lolium perenne]